jgi:hypothetical protein
MLRMATLLLISLVIANPANLANLANLENLENLENPENLLKQARAAAGGEKALGRIQGLSLTGTLQRMIGDRQVDGEVTLDLQLPDKMLRTDNISPMGDSTLIVTTQGMSGDKVLRGSKVVNAPPGAMIRVPPAPAPGSDAEAQALRASRADFVRLIVALLLTAPSSFPLEFASGGVAESPDGKADVIDVKGAGSFAARLFLDQTSHRLLMLTYRGVSQRIVLQRQQVPPPDAGRAEHQPPARGEGAGAGRGRGDDMPLPAQEVVEITMFFDDYREVDGVMLPHHITRSVEGQPNEEMTFKSVKTNPAFKADTFSAK